MDYAERISYDSRCRFSSKYITTSDQISVVVVDQDSLDWAKEEMGWSWPWPRESCAKIIDYFNRGNAASVSFDMIYSEKSIYGEEDDEAFARACRDYGRVVQSVYYSGKSSTEGTVPVDILKDSANMLGCVSSNLDESDRLERSHFFYTTAGNQEPVMAVAALAVNDVLPDFDSIPRAKNGGMYIRYVDELYRFVPYSAREILQSAAQLEAFEKYGTEINEDEYIPCEQFDGSYVFYAVSAPGLFDIIGTPISSTYPGVEVHLCQLNSFLKNDYLRDTPVWFNIILILLSVTGGFFIASSISQARTVSLIIRTICAVGILFVYIILNYFFYIKGLIIPFALPLLAFGLSYITVIFNYYLTEGRQKRFIKSAFSQYLSPQVIDSLIENPELLNLGGVECEVTAYFSDIQGFTSIAENLSPKQLTDVLNKYLTAMTDIILKFGGTIDKYEGDAIIAFWGAPTSQPDQAKRAVEAALACQKKLSEMSEELTEVCGKPIFQRIGINTGKAIVGNMGSASRFDYTMMGDSVNLASRLEGINKQFGTYTICSEATMESAMKYKADCEFHQISNIAVVGKKAGVKIYEPMPREVFEASKEIREKFDEAYGLFVSGNFDEAKKLFTENADKDPVSASYIEKCERIKNSITSDWDGILRATEK